MRSVSLFGSVARGDESVDSDVDLAVLLGNDFSKGGFDYCQRMDDLRKRFSEITGCPVDVVEEPVRRQRLQAEIDRDRALAF